jgi:hypothetical protein
MKLDDLEIIEETTDVFKRYWYNTKTNTFIKVNGLHHLYDVFARPSRFGTTEQELHTKFPRAEARYEMGKPLYDIDMLNWMFKRGYVRVAMVDDECTVECNNFLIAKSVAIIICNKVKITDLIISVRDPESDAEGDVVDKEFESPESIAKFLGLKTPLKECKHLTVRTY